jgi:hypothetical protein
MEEHYEADKEYVDGLLTCEKDFLLELVESGSTWANAKSLLAKQNEKFGKPVVWKEVTFKDGRVGKYYDWAIPEPEPEPEA